MQYRWKRYFLSFHQPVLKVIVCILSYTPINHHMIKSLAFVDFLLASFISRRAGEEVIPIVFNIFYAIKLLFSTPSCLRSQLSPSNLPVSQLTAISIAR